MKARNILFFSLGALLALSLTGCEQEDIMSIGDLEIPPKGSGVEIVVEPDDGITSVNALAKAVETYGAGTYILRRNGVYYVEGKHPYQSNIVVKAEEGEGQMPVIQPISDEQGAMPNYLFELECDSARFENVYFLLRDAATGNLHDRAIRLTGTPTRVEIDHCILETATSTFFRCDNSNNNIFISNSVIRNISRPTSASNGRVVDTRGHDQDSIVLRNNYIYNVTGQILRQDNSMTKYYELSHNTCWNVANVQNLDCPYEMVFENNIFANWGWKPLKNNPENPQQWVFDLSAFSGRETMKDNLKISIRNNNFYFAPEVEALYTQYPGSKRTDLSNATGVGLRADQFVYENNISEVLTFDYAPALPLAYIQYFFANPSESDCTEPFDSDEDGVIGVINGEMFTFRYAPSFRSATASTTGGPLGADIEVVF